LMAGQLGQQRRGDSGYRTSSTTPWTMCEVLGATQRLDQDDYDCCRGGLSLLLCFRVSGCRRAAAPSAADGVAGTRCNAADGSSRCGGGSAGGAQLEGHPPCRCVGRAFEPSGVAVRGARRRFTPSSGGCDELLAVSATSVAQNSFWGCRDYGGLRRHCWKPECTRWWFAYSVWLLADLFAWIDPSAFCEWKNRCSSMYRSQD
jgi:hypothetical protein